MPERLARLPQFARLALATVCAAVAVSGCAEAQPQPDKPALQMERCFDEPLPRPIVPELPEVPDVNDPHYQQKSKEWDKSYALYQKYESPPLLTMRLRESGFFDEEERPSTSVENALKDSNVLVLDEEANSKGSGFLATAPDGAKAVVTAAHVVASNDLHKITVKNKNNQAVGVAGGCYVYEEEGKFANLLGGETTDVDLAILSLEEPLAGTALKLAKGFPERGTWLAFVNNQGDYEPDYPASYSGFVVSQVPGTLGNMAMTGVQPWRKDIGGGKSYAIHEGGSGGLVAGMDGRVVGITYTASTGYWGAADAENIFGVRFDHPVGPETGILPVTTSIVGANIIQSALATQRY